MLTLQVSDLNVGSPTLIQFAFSSSTFDSVMLNATGAAATTLQRCQRLVGKPVYSATSFAVSVSVDNSACGLASGVIAGIAVGAIAFVIAAIALPLMVSTSRKKAVYNQKLKNLANAQRKGDDTHHLGNHSD